MATRNRREFLAEVGQGMLVAAVGSAVALDMGLSEAEVEQLLLDNRPIGIDVVRRVERHLAKPAGTFDDWADKHIQSFYQRAVCSEASAVALAPHALV